MALDETRNDLLKDLGVDESGAYPSLDMMSEGETKYVKDLRINVKNVLQSEHISLKEAYLLALSIAVNERNKPLTAGFEKHAAENGASKEEIAEIHAITSMLSVNNVFYRFRHFAEKESYNSMPARIKMNVMLRPVLGKEFFELVSLAVSAVNGCESCVKSHEASVMNHGASEERIFDAIRIASVIRGLSQAVS